MITRRNGAGPHPDGQQKARVYRDKVRNERLRDTVPAGSKRGWQSSIEQSKN